MQVITSFSIGSSPLLWYYCWQLYAAPLLCSLILYSCYVAGTWVLCSNSLLGIVWTTNNGLLKGIDQGTMHCDCCRNLGMYVQILWLLSIGKTYFQMI